jgi:hypothetical protein
MKLCVALAVASAAGLASPALAQTWTETGDAPELLSGAQFALGTGSMTQISGTIGAASDTDLYAFEICDFANFSATTVGQTTLDTQLFLFNSAGLGVTSNDDSQTTNQSTITALNVTSNGLYYLAISAYNRDPVSSGGLIFNPPAFTTEQGPNGPGAASPLSAWSGTTAVTGAYAIALTGSCFVDQSATGACCQNDGTCAVVSPGACTSSGGLYRGANSTCAGAGCAPGGSCCKPDSTCAVLTNAACAAASGVWAGAGSVCGSCSGACCSPDGTCSLVSAQSCAGGASATYLGNGTTCASGNCRPISFLSLPLAYNWNGLVSGATEQGATNYSDPNGYRAIADRGLLLGAAGSIASGVTGTDSMPYTIRTQDHALDIVHLGDRRYVANGFRNWAGAGGDTNAAAQPSWLPDNDQATVAQVSPMSGVAGTLTAESRIGVIYQISDTGGRFDCTLTFTDNSTATITMRAADWFSGNNPVHPGPTPGSGLIAQHKLGSYAATQNTDTSASTTNNLDVVEAVMSVPRLATDGYGSFAGKRLASISFQNPVSNANYPNSTPATGSGFAILAATLSYPGGSACYANCDNSTTAPVLNVQDFSCFLTKYASGDSYANCDNSTTQPVLNVQDFSCFLTKYASGCP